MKSRKLTAAVLSFVVGLSIVGCGNTGMNDSAKASTLNEASKTESSTSAAASTENSQADAKPLQPNTDAVNTRTTDETLHITLASEPSTLWGAASGKLEDEDVLINYALFDTLVRNDISSGEVVPNLATSWEWVDDTHCRFTLRDDVTMTDGTPLVADDVVYTANVWMTQSPGTDTGMYIAGAKAEDDHTVILAFTTSAPDILSMLGWSQFGIASEDEVNAAGGLDKVQTHPVVGSGKYRFKEWNRGTSITLERNDNYWNPDYKGYFKEIVFNFTADPAARQMAVASGDTDLAYDVPVSQAATFLSDDTLKVYVFTGGNIDHLWYNMGDNAGATKELKVRQAIDKALDFNAIAQIGTAGTAVPVLGYAGPDSKYYTQTFSEEERKVDIDGAKQLLEEAGYGEGLELSILGTQSSTAVATVIQANLAQAGINLNINTVDTAQFVEAAFGGDYDLICVPEQLITRAPNILSFLRKANIYGNGMVIGGPKWTTDELDNQISALVQEKDNVKATEELAAIEQTLKEQMVCSNLYPSMKAHITSTALRGMTSPDRGYLDVTTLYKE